MKHTIEIKCPHCGMVFSWIPNDDGLTLALCSFDDGGCGKSLLIKREVVTQYKVLKVEGE